MAEPTLKELEAEIRQMGKLVDKALNPGPEKRIGFTLLLFNFGEGGYTTYISNGNRDDVIKSLKEFLIYVETQRDVPPWGTGG